MESSGIFAKIRIRNPVLARIISKYSDEIDGNQIDWEVIDNEIVAGGHEDDSFFPKLVPECLKGSRSSLGVFGSIEEFLNDLDVLYDDDLDEISEDLKIATKEFLKALNDNQEEINANFESVSWLTVENIYGSEMDEKYARKWIDERNLQTDSLDQFYEEVEYVTVSEEFKYEAEMGDEGQYTHEIEFSDQIAET